jgi:hypothetical protein
MVLFLLKYVYLDLRTDKDPVFENHYFITMYDLCCPTQQQNVEARAYIHVYTVHVQDL